MELGLFRRWNVDLIQTGEIMKTKMIVLAVAVLALGSAVLLKQGSSEEAQAPTQAVAAEWQSESTDMMLAGDGGGDGGDGGVGAGGDF
jgi:hypothetical protein